MKKKYEIVGKEYVFSYATGKVCVKYGQYYFSVEYDYKFKDYDIYINFIDETSYEVFKGQEENFIIDEKLLFRTEIEIKDLILLKLKKINRNKKIKKLLNF